jgi:hypothetical protein
MYAPAVAIGTVIAPGALRTRRANFTVASPPESD